MGGGGGEDTSEHRYLNRNNIIKKLKKVEKHKINSFILLNFSSPIKDMTNYEIYSTT